MAAAEALYNTQRGAPFSLLRHRCLHQAPAVVSQTITIPHGLSLLATTVVERHGQGHQPHQAADQKKYGPGDYVPIVGDHLLDVPHDGRAGLPLLLLALVGLMLQRSRRLEPRQAGFLRVAIVGAFAAHPRQLDRLDLHRDGPPAMGRVRPAQHGESALAVGRQRRLVGSPCAASS